MPSAQSTRNYIIGSCWVQDQNGDTVEGLAYPDLESARAALAVLVLDRTESQRPTPQEEGEDTLQVTSGYVLEELDLSTEDSEWLEVYRLYDDDMTTLFRAWIQEITVLPGGSATL